MIVRLGGNLLQAHIVTTITIPNNTPPVNKPFLFKYNHLYNWYAVSDTRGIAPAGWHLPSDDEWKTLENISHESI